MKETISDEKHITEQAKKITELCNNLTCYSAKDFVIHVNSIKNIKNILFLKMVYM